MESKKLSKENQAIMDGLELARKKMIKFKKYKGTPLVISRNGEIVHIPAKDLPDDPI